MNEELHILLRRFRWRLMVAQGVRRLGLACAVVVVICLLATLLQRLTGIPLLPRAAMVSTAVAAIWMVIGLRRRPTLGAVALEIDRQRGLRELLSSAVLAGTEAGFDRCVVAAATERARSIQMEELSTGGYGAAAWVAVLLLLGLLPLVYRAPVGASEAAAVASARTAEVVDDRLAASSRDVQRQSPSPPAAQTPGASAITVSSAAGVDGRPTAAPRPTRSDMAGISAGGGLAQDQQSAPAAPVPLPAAVSTQREPGVAGNSGGGLADPHGAGTSTGRGHVNAAGALANDGNGVPDGGRAEGTMEAPAMPEAYRDVIKAYFAR